MFRLLYFFLCCYLILKAMRFLWRYSKIKMRGRSAEFDFRRPGSARSIAVIDEMWCCSHCQTYSPRSSGLEKNGLYFCHAECQENFSHSKKEVPA